MTKMVDVTIRMPEDWFDHFWGWYLDGGGDQGFMMDLDTTECESECSWSDWDRKRRLLVHAMNESDLKAAMNVD